MQEDTLKLGDAGNNVKILQEKLKILGFYNALITGEFSLSTEVGVKAFQKENNLEETGEVGRELWQLLFEQTDNTPTPYSNYPTLKRGDNNNYVKDLQTKLKTLLYYTGNISTLFDLETENAVKRFQFHNNLTTSGIVNNQTWNMINALFGTLNECVIGETEEDYLSYIVKPGDTLYSIARKYNTTVDVIKKLNQLTTNTLTIGETLYLPISNEEENYNTYTVTRGDTLYSIAISHNTTVDEIKRLNNLTSNTLSIGQVLYLPKSSNNNSPNTYTVVSGDTLYSIARKYNTTPDAIKRLNDLTSNTISIGQVLEIPAGNTNNYVTYKVARGDTLYSIANRYNTTVDKIKSLNNLTSNILTIGQILKIEI